jgi:MFS family permease
MPYWVNLFRSGNNEGITGSETSLIVSILSAGTFFGALFAAPCADYLGRRMGIILSTGIVFNLGVIMQTAATSQPLFVAGRFFAGLGVGLISAMSKLVYPMSWQLLIKCFSSSLPVGDGAQMDQRYYCRSIPACNHYRPLYCCSCQQFNKRPQ